MPCMPRAVKGKNENRRIRYRSAAIPYGEFNMNPRVTNSPWPVKPYSVGGEGGSTGTGVLA